MAIVAEKYKQQNFGIYVDSTGSINGTPGQVFAYNNSYKRGELSNATVNPNLPIWGGSGTMVGQSSYIIDAIDIEWSPFKIGDKNLRSSYDLVSVIDNVYSKVNNVGFIAQHIQYDWINFISFNIPKDQAQLQNYVIIDFVGDECKPQRYGKCYLSIRRENNNTVGQYGFLVKNFGSKNLPKLRLTSDDNCTFNLWMKCVKAEWDPYIHFCISSHHGMSYTIVTNGFVSTQEKQIPIGALTNLDAENIRDITTPSIKGTQTSSTGSWQGSLVGTRIDALYNGFSINYYLPYTGNGDATLELILDDYNNTTTGPINCYFNGNTRLNTQYGAGAIITLTYYSAGTVSINGIPSTDNRWIANTATASSSADSAAVSDNADTVDGYHADSFVIDAGGNIKSTIYSIPSKRVFSGINVTDAPVTGWISGISLGSNWNNDHYQHYIIENGNTLWHTRTYSSTQMTNWLKVLDDGNTYVVPSTGKGVINGTEITNVDTVDGYHVGMGIGELPYFMLGPRYNSSNENIKNTVTVNGTSGTSLTNRWETSAWMRNWYYTLNSTHDGITNTFGAVNDNKYATPGSDELFYFNIIRWLCNKIKGNNKVNGTRSYKLLVAPNSNAIMNIHIYDCEVNSSDIPRYAWGDISRFGNKDKINMFMIHEYEWTYYDNSNSNVTVINQQKTLTTTEQTIASISGQDIKLKGEIATGNSSGTGTKGMLSVNTSTLTMSDLNAAGTKFGLTIDNGVIKFATSTDPIITLTSLTVQLNTTVSSIAWTSNKFTTSNTTSAKFKFNGTEYNISNISPNSSGSISITPIVNTNQTLLSTSNPTIQVSLVTVNHTNIRWSDEIYYSANSTTITGATKYRWAIDGMGLTDNCRGKYIFVPITLADTKQLKITWGGSPYTVPIMKTVGNYRVYDLTNFGNTAALSYSSMA